MHIKYFISICYCLFFLFFINTIFLLKKFETSFRIHRSACQWKCAVLLPPGNLHTHLIVIMNMRTTMKIQKISRLKYKNFKINSSWCYFFTNGIKKIVMLSFLSVDLHFANQLLLHLTIGQVMKNNVFCTKICHPYNIIFKAF
uniref:Secreted protein n=1 Tax=Heterorhabditis bacteriophora TaxID=37862 RepID=A0A1I7WA29_HETBA